MTAARASFADVVLSFLIAIATRGILDVLVASADGRSMLTIT